MTAITDPAREIDPIALSAIIDTVAASAPVLADSSLTARAQALNAVADALDASVDELVALAHDESGLPLFRLTGEVARTTGQLRLFAAELEDGSWLDVIIDTADPQAVPVPRPELRRMQVAAGPVVVFAASNFPFAFSVAGGDTASALAAGCPVVVKAHPGHPETARRTAAIVTAAWEGAGMPVGSFALVEGEQTGVAVLQHPAIAAGAFTGSESGGTALARIAADREVPIPFYAEMGSLNPVFVTPGALAARGDEIASGYVGSFTLGVGQFCTKPGLLFLPRGHGLDERLAAAVREVAPARMLVPRIAEASHQGQTALSQVPGVRTIAAVAPPVDTDLLGGTAIRRFLRPVVYQDYPAALLPPALQDTNPLAVLRRVDGEFTRASI
jgi:NADP-dependent aldehyde dehydrogenase